MSEENKVSTAVIDGVTVNVQGAGLTMCEIASYVKHCTGKYKGKRISRIDISLDGEYADLYIELNAMGFDRIRRITGYLVGTLDRFNNAKREEVGDRVRHNI